MIIIKRYAYGLDLSLSCSGIVIFDIDELEPVLITSIDTNDKLEHGNRLYEQYEFMEKVVARFPPEVVYIEKGFSRHAVATQALFKVVGCYNMLLRDYPVEYFAPTTVKKHITGNGRAEKGKVQDILLQRFPKAKFRNQDQSDALGVVITGLIKNGLIEWEIPNK